MSNNLFSITNALNKEDKKTITRDKKDKDKILSPYSQNNTQKKITPVEHSEEVFNSPKKELEHSEEVFDAPKKLVNNVSSNVNPYYTQKSGNRYFDSRVEGAEKLYKIKKEYEDIKALYPQFDNSDYAKILNSQANRLRSEYNLEDSSFGSGVTSQDVLNKINYILDSPEYQMSKENTDYINLLKKYDDERKALLTTEDKKRAILSYIDAQKQASDIIKPQAEQAIKDTINAQNTAAIRRGMYGQTPASAFSANAIANTQNQINSQINSLALDLIEKDNARATEEYNIARQNKLDKLSAIEQAILSAEKARQVANEYNMLRKEDDERKENLAYDEKWRNIDNEYRDKVFDRGVVESDRAYEQSEEQFDWTKETDERDYNRGVYEDDRNFNRGVVESDRAYEQSEEQFDWQKNTDERNFNRSVFESDREHEFNEEQFDYKKDTDNREYNLALAKASRGGNSSGGVKTVGNAGISKEGANYIDNYLLHKINNILRDKYDSGVLDGKSGAYNFVGKFGVHAYEDVIVNEVLKSDLSDDEAETFLKMLNVSDDAINHYSNKYSKKQ